MKYLRNWIIGRFSPRMIKLHVFYLHVRLINLNERLMLRQGWVPERKLHEFDARADRLIRLWDGVPVTTDKDVMAIAGHMNRIMEANEAVARKKDRIK